MVSNLERLYERLYESDRGRTEGFVPEALAA